jgi:hypothetical protein
MKALVLNEDIVIEENTMLLNKTSQ